jgi:hypothetical protein
MTHSPGVAGVALKSARWVLPWIAVLFVSVTLAYAMGSAIDGWASAGDRQPEVQAAASTTGKAGSTGVLQQSMTSLSDSAMTPTGGAFGVTSPASTGHASSDGCCTWD